MALQSFFVILVNCVNNKKKLLTKRVLILVYNKSYVDSRYARLKVMLL